MLRKIYSANRISLIILVPLMMVSLLVSCTSLSFGPVTQGSEQAATEVPSDQTDSTSDNEPIEGTVFIEGEDSIILIEEIVIILLFIAILVAIAARWLRVPYTLGLVVIGLLLTLIPQVDINIPPSLIFGLLIPPLLF